MVSFDTETLRDLRDRADRACQETRVLVEQLKSSTERARDYLDDAYDKPRDANEGRALMETKQVLHQFFQREDRFDEIVRQKIQSLSRHVPPGSREWDVLYRKYLEEEMRKERK